MLNCANTMSERLFKKNCNCHENEASLSACQNQAILTKKQIQQKVMENAWEPTPIVAGTRF